MGHTFYSFVRSVHASAYGSLFVAFLGRERCGTTKEQRT